jgi:hypothetical protein
MLLSAGVPSPAELEELAVSVRAWLADPHVNGLSVAEKLAGGRPTGRQAIVVHVVCKKAPSELTGRDLRIPASLPLEHATGDGRTEIVDVPTDVIEVGGDRIEVLDQRVRPVPGGYQIRAAGINGSGTLGVSIDWGGRYRMLAANHVISVNGNLGATVYQPTVAAENAVAQVSGYVPVITYAADNHPNPVYNLQDLAFCDTTEKVGSPAIHQLGKPGGIRAPRVGESISMIGKQTGHVRSATIDSITLTKAAVPWCGAYAWFERMIQLSAVITQSGDSGAAYVADSDGWVVGIHTAANSHYSWGSQLWPF